MCKFEKEKKRKKNLLKEKKKRKQAIFQQIPEVYLEPCRQTSKIERFPEIVDSFQWSSIFAKRSIPIQDIWRGFECASETIS